MNARDEDPVLISARREALLVLAIWLTSCVYSISVSYRLGYGRDVATLTYVLGFPDWVFWGVVAPWTVCTLLSFVLSYFVIRDEDLGEEQAEEQIKVDPSGPDGPALRVDSPRAAPVAQGRSDLHSRPEADHA